MKDAYYFSHDCNARHDPKITAMRGVYGSEGYGWYWMLIEMMREAEGYRLRLTGKYTFNAFAMQLQSESSVVESFVRDCIEEFELFQSDGETFWSESLLRRMEIRDQKSEVRRQAARVRWDREKKQSGSAKNADQMQNESKSDANAMQGKERKVKESKGKESKGEREEPAAPDSPPPKEDDRDRIERTIKDCKVEVDFFTLDQVLSYIGAVETGLIEAAIKKSGGKSTKYAASVLQGWVSEGKTKLEHVLPKTETAAGAGRLDFLNDI